MIPASDYAKKNPRDTNTVIGPDGQIWRYTARGWETSGGGGSPGGAGGSEATGERWPTQTPPNPAGTTPNTSWYATPPNGGEPPPNTNGGATPDWGATTAGRTGFFSLFQRPAGNANLPSGGTLGALGRLAGREATPTELASASAWGARVVDPTMPGESDWVARLKAAGGVLPYEGEVASTYRRLNAGRGWDNATRAAMIQENTGSARRALDQSKDDLRRRLAQAGDSAGFYGATAEAEAEAGRSLGEVTRRNLIDFAKEEERQREAGAAGLQSLGEASARNRQGGLAMEGDYFRSLDKRQSDSLEAIDRWNQAQRALELEGVHGLQHESDAASQNALAWAQLLAEIGRTPREVYKTERKMDGGVGISV